MPTIIKSGFAFNDLAPYHGLFIFNEAIGDAGAGEEMPSPLTWNTTSPVGDVDWSAFTVAVDAAGINRSNRAGATLVSPSYCVYATHGPGDNTGHTWMTPAGVEVTRTFASTTSLDTDLTLAKLSSPINNIDPMPILANCVVLSSRNCLCIEMDRHLNLFTIPSGVDNSDSVVTIEQTSADAIESGDSGKPVVVLINGVAVMVVTAITSSDVGEASGHNASHYISEINAILAVDDEELTLWVVGRQSAQSASGGTVSASAAPDSMPFILY